MAKAEIAAVLLALGAALVSAVGNVMRQRSAHEIMDKPVGTWSCFFCRCATPAGGGAQWRRWPITPCRPRR